MAEQMCLRIWIHVCLCVAFVASERCGMWRYWDDVHYYRSILFSAWFLASVFQMCLCFYYECRMCNFFNFNLHGVTSVAFTSDNELMFHSGSNQNLHHDVVIILHHDVVIKYVIMGDCTQFDTLCHKFLMLYLLSLLHLTHCLHELNQHFWPFSNSILFYFQLITFF